VARPIKQRGKWRIRWFDQDGARQSAVFTDYRAALDELRRREAEVTEVRLGLRPRRPAARSFDELCDYWIEHRAPRKRSGKDDESIIRVHLRPAFGRLQLANVGLADVDAFVATRGHLDPKTVANLLTMLIAMLNYAKDLGWLQSVPRIRKPRVRFNEHDFHYLRTVDEIRRLLQAASAEGAMALALYSTAVYTGLRAGELADLTWDLINFETRLITVRGSFGGPTKGGDTRYVPILDPLLIILREWRLKNPLTVVFPNANGGKQGPSARIFQEIFHRVLDAAGFPKVHRRGKERRYLVFHDLRHTFASHWVMNGGDVFKLQRVLGHKSMVMTMRYAHLAPDAFAADYGRLGADPRRDAVVLPLKRESILH
jgi:integrase